MTKQEIQPTPENYNNGQNDEETKPTAFAKIEFESEEEEVLYETDNIQVTLKQQTFKISPLFPQPSAELPSEFPPELPPPEEVPNSQTDQ